MYDLERNLEKAKVERCLQNDPVLRKSLGIKLSFKSLKQTAIILAVWLVILFFSPLPEWMLLNRIGLFATLLVLLICWQIDRFSHKLEIEEAAESLYGILKNDPKITLEPLANDEVLIRHAKFQARCGMLTQLQFKAMLDVEEEVQSSIKSVLETPMLLGEGPAPDPPIPAPKKKKARAGSKITE